MLFFTGRVVTKRFIFPYGLFVKMRLERPCGCAAMKAPVGLSSRRAICDSRWKGFALTSVGAATNAKSKKYFSLESAVLQCGQLVDAALMAAAFKLGVQEEIHQLAGKAGTYAANRLHSRAGRRSGGACSGGSTSSTCR